MGFARARLAAEAAAGATAAYGRYLPLRTEPEPTKIPQRDSVRAELARLVQ